MLAKVATTAHCVDYAGSMKRVLVCVALVSCASAPTSKAEPNTTPSGSASQVAATVPPAPSVPLEPATNPDVVSPLITVAVLPSSVQLFATSKTVFVQFRDRREDGLTHMGVIENDTVVEKSRLSFSAGGLSEVIAIDADWPASADMLVTASNGRVGFALHFTLGKDAWEQKGFDNGYIYSGLARVGGSVLGLRTGGLLNNVGRPSFVSIRGGAAPRTFAPYNGACNDSYDAHAPPKVQSIPEALGDTANGTLIALGTDACDATVTAEVWAPNERSSRVLTVSTTWRKGAYEEFRVIRGNAPDEAFFLHGQVSRYDGKDVSALPPLPERDRAVAAAVAPNGQIHVLTARRTSYQNGEWVTATPARIYKLEGDAWQELPSTDPDSIAFGPDGTLWVSAGQLLQRLRRNAGEVSLAVSKEALATVAKRIPTLKAPRAPGPNCKNHLVVLYGFTKTTPADYDFPLTRKALKGHREFSAAKFVVATDGGAKFLSAIVPDRATGQKLVALIEKQVKDSKPQLLCASPQIERELAIDLATGELVKP